MSERLIKLKFLGTPYFVTIDTRSVTLKKAQNMDDKFPVPLGYHRSIFSLCDVLLNQGLTQVKGDITVKSFCKRVKELHEQEIKPFLSELQAEQVKLNHDLSKALEVHKDHKRLVDLVASGKLDEAKDLATKLKG